MNKNKGFTLIEVILVLTIMGILFTISFRQNPAKSFSIEQEIESLAADMRWARNKAILDNQTYIFRIYTIKEDINSNKIPYYFYLNQNGEKIIKKKGYYSSNLILYTTLSFNPVESDYYEWIRFNHSATARGGTIAFSRAEAGVEKLSITVNQLGRVRIEK